MYNTLTYDYYHMHVLRCGAYKDNVYQMMHVQHLCSGVGLSYMDKVYRMSETCSFIVYVCVHAYNW